jgi:hypothetical protein
VTAIAPEQDSPNERQDAESRAWGSYRDDLRDLDGREYDDAEKASWDRLQERLREIALEHDA